MSNSQSVNIDNVNDEVNVVLTFGSNPNSVSAGFTLSDGATADPASPLTVDFTTPVTITLTAEDGVTERIWTVNVTVASE